MCLWSPNTILMRLWFHEYYAGHELWGCSSPWTLSVALNLLSLRFSFRFRYQTFEAANRCILLSVLSDMRITGRTIFWCLSFSACILDFNLLMTKKNKKFKLKQKILKFPAFSNLSFWIALISRPFLHFLKHTYHFFSPSIFICVCGNDHLC